MQRLIQLCLVVIVVNVSFSAFAEQDMVSNKQLKSVAPVLSQPYMNVFRRFSADPEDMYKFYGEILGFRQSTTFKLGGNIGMAWFQVGALSAAMSSKTRI